METKTCSNCGEEKPVSEFHKNKLSKDGIQSSCRVCKNKYRREYHSKNKEKENIRSSNYYKENQDKIKKKTKEWYLENKNKAQEYSKKYRQINRHKISCQRKKHRSENLDDMRKQERERRDRDKKKISDKAYREKNKEKISKTKKKRLPMENERRRERYKKNPEYRILNLLRTSLRQAVKAQGLRKRNTVLILCGCTLEDLKTHIESQFQPGMTWENHSKYGWHIDHIRPCASFDLSDQEQQKQCFHYTNLQPLWWKENLSKNSIYNGVNYRNMYNEK